MLEERLPQLAPFADLGARAQQKLLQHASTLEIKPGLKLHARDEWRHLIFLLEGRVILSDDGQSVILKGGSPESLNPLFNERDYHSHAIAASSGRLALFDRKVYENLIDGAREGVEVSEIELSDLEGELFTSIYTRAFSGELQLPQLRHSPG